MHYNTIDDWRKRRKKKEATASNFEISAKIRQLEKESAELRWVNEILKDALGFLAKDQKK